MVSQFSTQVKGFCSVIRKLLVRLAVLSGALLVFIILAVILLFVFHEEWTQEEIEWCKEYRLGLTMEQCALEFIK